MKHNFYDRDDGLAHCKVCGGGEGSLPTECPGRRMTAEEQDKVYGLHLDFNRGQWWSPVLAHDEAALRKAIYDEVCEIMIEHGPDGHTDGSDVLTEMVMRRLREGGGPCER